jgi:polyisoprenoid-binding protein YceI
MSAAVATPPVVVRTWNIDPAHSAAEFKVRHMMISNVKGRFAKLHGALLLDERDITRSRVETSIEAGSIDTRDEQRDAHLKSPDFFDVGQFPMLSFKSTRVSRKSDDELAVTGHLTIHGITQEVVFAVEGPTSPAKDPWGNTRIGLSVMTQISRKDFGLTWNATLESGGILVGDEVTITLDVQFVRV